jgi:hypothetical protein
MRAEEIPGHLSAFRHINSDAVTLRFATFGSLIPVGIFSHQILHVFYDAVRLF